MPVAIVDDGFVYPIEVAAALLLKAQKKFWGPSLYVLR
jgi:hypothetical protein